MSDNESRDVDFKDFLDNLYDTNYRDMFFRNKPISPSRESAIIDSDVDKFLTKKYDVNTDDKDEDYFSFFMERLLERTLDEGLQGLHL
jgi:hypothetical protein